MGWLETVLLKIWDVGIKPYFADLIIFFMKPIQWFIDLIIKWTVTIFSYIDYLLQFINRNLEKLSSFPFNPTPHPVPSQFQNVLNFLNYIFPIKEFCEMALTIIGMWVTIMILKYFKKRLFWFFG